MMTFILVIIIIIIIITITIIIINNIIITVFDTMNIAVMTNTRPISQASWDTVGDSSISGPSLAFSCQGCMKVEAPTPPLVKL